jgi:hypothetical protein
MRRLILFLIFSLPAVACLAQSDSTRSALVTDTVTRIASIAPADHQVRFGFDISRIAFNLANTSRYSYEMQADYSRNAKLYMVAEAGWGGSTTDYEHLKYKGSNFFLRAGVDQSLLDRMGLTDFDMAFLGIRYGIGLGNRSEASFLVPSPFGPPAQGTEPAESYIVHWGEVTAGVKVEMWKGFFAGWNMRMKFLLNPGRFERLSPSYIAGYGKGDKTTAFDFNFYLSYALRWKR